MEYGRRNFRRIKWRIGRVLEHEAAEAYHKFEIPALGGQIDC